MAFKVERDRNNDLGHFRYEDGEGNDRSRVLLPSGFLLLFLKPGSFHPSKNLDFQLTGIDDKIFPFLRMVVLSNKLVKLRSTNAVEVDPARPAWFGCGDWWAYFRKGNRGLIHGTSTRKEMLLFLGNAGHQWMLDLRYSTLAAADDERVFRSFFLPVANFLGWISRKDIRRCRVK